MKHLFLIILFCSSVNVYSQTWQLLPNSPTAEYINDDIFFVGTNKGWMVNLAGFIYKTEDAGNSWDTLIIKPGTAYRCIGFVDSLHGFAGNLGPGSWISNVSDTIPLYETIDGGYTWNPVSNISGKYPKGICGIRVVDDSVIYAVGRYDKPAVFMKTVDGGKNWVSTDMSDKFKDLIDVWFFSRDTGIIAGGDGVRSVIYYTDNGGATWKQVFKNSEKFGWHWKISFPSRMVGYSSIEGGTSNANRVAKTIDGGLTWSLKPFNVSNVDATGIGFFTDSLGWICADYPGVVYETQDGGDTWAIVPLDKYFNRFRKVDSATAYICGSRVWKYADFAVTAPSETVAMKPGYQLHQNIPNPFSRKTNISYTIPEAGVVTLRIFDRAGRTLSTIVNQQQQAAGTYKYEFSLPKSIDTYFICKLDVNGYSQVIRMVMKGPGK